MDVFKYIRKANGLMFTIYHFTSFTQLCSGELLSRYATLACYDSFFVFFLPDLKIESELGIICSELLFYEMVSGFSLQSRIHIKCLAFPSGNYIDV